MQHRTEDTKVWAYSNTGTKAHAFLRILNGKMYAACRGNIVRNADATTMTAEDVSGTLCTRCATLLASYLDRVAASMEPATEADDLGYVHVETTSAAETITGSRFCGACGDVFRTTADLDVHQDATGHERTPTTSSPVTSYELPAPLVDVVYEGIVIPEGVQLFENRECRVVVVHGTAAGHRALATKMVRIVADRPANRLAGRSALVYSNWAHHQR